jgi:hypothetical protein
VKPVRAQNVKRDHLFHKLNGNGWKQTKVGLQPILLLGVWFMG